MPPGKGQGNGKSDGAFCLSAIMRDDRKREKGKQKNLLLWFHSLHRCGCIFRGGEDAYMNQRQRKKNYKKKHGVNPPAGKQIESIDILQLMRNVANAVEDFLKGVQKVFENIQTMPNTEFKEKLCQLTPEQQSLALKIRNKEKGIENGQSGKMEKCDKWQYQRRKSSSAFELPEKPEEKMK